MSALPGYQKFPMGNVSLIQKYGAERLANAGKKAMKMVAYWLCDQLNPEAGPDNYNPSKDPVVVSNLGGNVHLMVADPDMVQDLLVSKNSIFDKTGMIQGIFSKLMGDSFLFSRADAAWKTKRKACSHAFYKDRLVHMIEVLKQKMADSCKEWMAVIAKEGYTDISLGDAFQDIFVRNIITISFGEDVSDSEITMWHRPSREIESSEPFVLQKMSFGKALTLVNAQVATIAAKAKLSNPLYRAIYFATGHSVSFTSQERYIDDNSHRVRCFINEYVQKRKTAKQKTAVQNSSDLLSLFFQTPEVFTDEFIIDELVDFFAAASATTMNGSTAFIGHLATSPESLQKVRAEFEDICRQSEDYDPEDSKL